MQCKPNTLKPSTLKSSFAFEKSSILSEDVIRSCMKLFKTCTLIYIYACIGILAHSLVLYECFYLGGSWLEASIELYIHSDYYEDLKWWNYHFSKLDNLDVLLICIWMNNLLVIRKTPVNILASHFPRKHVLVLHKISLKNNHQACRFLIVFEVFAWTDQ